MMKRKEKMRQTKGVTAGFVTVTSNGEAKTTGTY